MKTNKLCGVEFEAPITLDEVPVEKKGFGTNRAYYMAAPTTDGWDVREYADNMRGTTRNHVATGMCHWTRKGAEAHCDAMYALVDHLEKHAA